MGWWTALKDGVYRFVEMHWLDFAVNAAVAAPDHGTHSRVGIVRAECLKVHQPLAFIVPVTLSGYKLGPLLSVRRLHQGTPRDKLDARQFPRVTARHFVHWDANKGKGSTRGRAGDGNGLGHDGQSDLKVFPLLVRCFLYSVGKQFILRRMGVQI
jgi:hypothetical protein